MDGNGIEGTDEPRRDLPPSLLEAVHRPDSVASWSTSVAPGADVMGPLSVLDPVRMSHAGRVDLLTSLEKASAWVASMQLDVLSAMADDPIVDEGPVEFGKHWVVEDVRAALHLSGPAAKDRLAFATEVTHRLPATREALVRGEIVVQQARVLAEAVIPLDDRQARKLEATVLPGAKTQSLATFRNSVRRALLVLNPATAEEDHAEAMTERRVCVTPDAAGMSVLWALLPSEGCAAVMTALDAAADRCGKNDPRTKDQQRADALVQLGINALHGGTADSSASADGLPLWQGLKPSVHVVVAASTLLGLDEQPGEIEDHGHVPASVVRRIAADQTGTPPQAGGAPRRRILTDERGVLLDCGRSTYRPPAELARHVITRDRTCRFPTCNRRARRCELDHRRAWADGGTTNAGNLDVLCRRHHHVKHKGGWTTRRTDDQSTEWISPTGHVYVEPPATYPTDTTTRHGDQPKQPDDPPF